ncbi:MAG: saccharopine dehydrogenase C-terminal domain-containing protein [Sphingobacteriia bacterium]|jgi:saccharopine dehydrogenase (NADP+, L-glutamate forming)
MAHTEQILLFGAGKSATVLIHYLAKICAQNQWYCTIVDIDEKLVQSKIGNSPFLSAKSIPIENEAERKLLIANTQLVISLLPPHLHNLVATSCLELGKHLLTASYIDDSIKKLENDIKSKGLFFLGEMGLDPGIDHMSAMQLIHSIQQKGGNIDSFKSHCGGLVAPESNNNPWKYKFSWNPRNIITAGKAGAIYKENNAIKEVSYDQIFIDCSSVEIPSFGKLAYYPNRDSMSYASLYGLETAATFIRTTLRYPEFCSGWQKMVEAGFTMDDELIDTDELSFGRFLRDRLSSKKISLDTPLLEQQFEFLGLYNNRSIHEGKKSYAAILQELLEEKWKLERGDKDLIVMLHEIDYTLNNEKHQVKSSLIVKGDDESNTAMAKTVGLPLGIAAKLILENKINLRGLHIPIVASIYKPVLEELSAEGILFEEN